MKTKNKNTLDENKKKQKKERLLLSPFGLSQLLSPFDFFGPNFFGPNLLGLDFFGPNFFGPNFDYPLSTIPATTAQTTTTTTTTRVSVAHYPMAHGSASLKKQVSANFAATQYPEISKCQRCSNTTTRDSQ